MSQWRKIVPARSASSRLACVRVQCSRSVRCMEAPVASAPSMWAWRMWASSKRAPRSETPVRLSVVVLYPMVQPRKSVFARLRASGRGWGASFLSACRV